MIAILGKKVGMTQIYDADGKAIPATVIKAGPCKVMQVKTNETDGYSAVQLGFEEASKVNKPDQGHNKKWGADKPRYIKEITIGEGEELKTGEVIDVNIFKNIKYVDATGVTKGKGFAGVIKKYHFQGGRASHGGRLSKRGTGSIGQCASPGRVVKGKKMPGRMGNKQVTVQSLEVVKIIPESNLLIVKGGVPGHKDTVLMIKKSVKKG